MWCVKNREHRFSFYLRRNCANSFPVESAQAGSKRQLMTLQIITIKMIAK